MRVAVIGAGIVGSSVGWHLARRGAEVVMIDAGEPGAGVTDWTFAWVNASNKTRTRRYFNLNVAGLAAWQELALELGEGDWWHPTGHLRWTGDPDAAQALHVAVDQLRSWGYEAQAWKGGQARQLLEPRCPSPATTPWWPCIRAKDGYKAGLSPNGLSPAAGTAAPRGISD